MPGDRSLGDAGESVGSRGCAVGLGSNLGDRAGTIARAVERLRAALRRAEGENSGAPVRVSGLVETKAVTTIAGVDPGPPYLNAAACFDSRLSARELLDLLMGIERELGRDRATQPGGGARVIDLDLLLVGRERINEPGLVVPHPGLARREFVLGPLAQIAGDWIVPGALDQRGASGSASGKTVRELLAALNGGTP